MAKDFIIRGAVVEMDLTDQGVAGDWRFGIDREQKSLLITTGIYGRIRHPIYTALKIAAVATLLIFPNLFFLCVTVPVFVGLTFLALLEEDFLRENFGKSYEEYFRKTRRFY